MKLFSFLASVALLVVSVNCYHGRDFNRNQRNQINKEELLDDLTEEMMQRRRFHSAGRLESFYDIDGNEDENEDEDNRDIDELDGYYNRKHAIENDDYDSDHDDDDDDDDDDNDEESEESRKADERDYLTLQTKMEEGSNERAKKETKNKNKKDDAVKKVVKITENRKKDAKKVVKIVESPKEDTKKVVKEKEKVKEDAKIVQKSEVQTEKKKEIVDKRDSKESSNTNTNTNTDTKSEDAEIVKESGNADGKQTQHSKIPVIKDVSEKKRKEEFKVKTDEKERNVENAESENEIDDEEYFQEQDLKNLLSDHRHDDHRRRRRRRSYRWRSDSMLKIPRERPRHHHRPCKCLHVFRHYGRSFCPCLRERRQRIQHFRRLPNDYYSLI